jgi:hypothetical protein
MPDLSFRQRDGKVHDISYHPLELPFILHDEFIDTGRIIVKLWNETYSTFNYYTTSRDPVNQDYQYWINIDDEIQKE